MSEDLLNVNGSDSGSDTSGSVGTDSGSDGSGSGGSVDGSGAGIGSGSGSGTDSGSGSGSGSADILDLEPTNGIVSGNQNVADGGSVRQRIRKPIRLGSAVRDSSTSGNGIGTGTGTGEKLDNDPVIRLGAKKQGAPRVSAKTENSVDLKLSEMKDLISMFLDTAFEVPALLLKQDFWKLSKDENKMLTDAVSAYIKSMPKDKSSWLMTFIQDNLPLVNLIMIGFFVVSDRVKHSIAISQVTRHANKFAEAASADVRVNQNGGQPIRTPMDNIFS